MKSTQAENEMEKSDINGQTIMLLYITVHIVHFSLFSLYYFLSFSFTSIAYHAYCCVLIIMLEIFLKHVLNLFGLITILQ